MVFDWELKLNTGGKKRGRKIRQNNGQYNKALDDHEFAFITYSRLHNASHLIPFPRWWWKNSSHHYDNSFARNVLQYNQLIVVPIADCHDC